MDRNKILILEINDEKIFVNVDSLIDSIEKKMMWEQMDTNIEDLKSEFFKMKKRIAFIIQYLSDCLTDVQVQVLDKSKTSFKNPLFTQESGVFKSKSKSKTCLSSSPNLNLNEVIIHRFLNKDFIKEEMLRLIIKQNISVPNTKIIIMNKFNISKATYYNYARELMIEGSLSPSLSPKSRYFKQNLDKS